MIRNIFRTHMSAGWIGILMLAIAYSSALYAEQLTPAQALQRLDADAGVARSKAVGSAVETKATLVYTSRAEGNSLYYVFSRPEGGFVITGADTMAPSLLGYSDSGDFDINEIPDAMALWLQQYDHHITAAIQSKTALRISAVTEAGDIEPLVKTHWGQGAPYNANCPQNKGKRCLTGCVATAMAQIMKYHSWPNTGEGYHATSSRSIPLYADFEEGFYKWTSMRNSYYSTDVSAQLAKLFHHCGVAVNMEYGLEASGASVAEAANALKKYFRYSTNTRYVSRSEFPDDTDWENMLLKELQAKRPIIYSGSGTGAHAFICDGYDGQLFHFNWGWDGYADGYFAVTGANALNPAEDDYSRQQAVVIGISPKYPEAERKEDYSELDKKTLPSLEDMKNYILQRPTSGKFDIDYADINLDGVIDVLDVQALEHILKK